MEHFMMYLKNTCIIIRYDISSIMYQVIKLDYVITSVDYNYYKGDKNESK
tara:strand:+ start:5005 stop:5154 length:150 start_codon:yes stop_codon:yes gene_type:complete